MALDGELEVRARHAFAVVGDADQPPPAAVGENVDAAAAGVERVLDQLLDHARRPLDHLAGGDAVDDGFGQLADGHGRGLIRNLPHITGAIRSPRGGGGYPRRTVCT